MLGVGVLAALAAAVVGCEAGPGRPLPFRYDPGRYQRCQDPAGRTAYQLAVVELQAGRDRQALPLLRSVVEVCPELVAAHTQYQDIAEAVGGEAAAAMRAFYRGLAADVDSPVPAFVKARLLASNYSRKSALDELLARHPDFAFAYLSLGRLSRGVGRLADASDSFQRAIDRDPQLLAAHLERAETLAELGRNAEAELPYRNYLARQPHDRDSIRAFVQLLLYKLNEPDEARVWIDQLLAADPRDERALMDLAAAEWRSGRLDQAVRYYLQVLAQRPDHARAALNIGHLFYDAMATTEASRREYWPRARKAYLLFQQLIRPEEGFDHFEKNLAVPYRLKRIEELLGPGDGKPPAVEDLR